MRPSGNVSARAIFMVLLAFLPLLLPAQSNPTALQAFDAYVQYGNRSGADVASVAKSIMNYYPDLNLVQKDSWRSPRYVCPVQPEDFYFNKAVGDSKGLDVNTAGTLNAQLRLLHAAAANVQTQCRALDTYHKLEDYKRDNFAQARELVNQLQEKIAQYRRQQNLFNAALQQAYGKRPNATAYTRADALMRQVIAQERTFLDKWTFNLQENVPTAAIDSALAQSVMNTNALLNELKQSKLTINYPASSQWSAFIENVAGLLEIKRNGQDGYNYEAHKTDRYANALYLSLINHYNGTLIAFYNSFLDYATADRYVGLKALAYIPAFDIRTEAVVRPVTVVPFQDTPRKTITIAAQTRPIATPAFDALKNYVQYIDETWRQTANLRDVISNLSTSAAYYKGLDSYARVGGMQFANKDFKLPLSAYQQLVASSKALPPAYAQALNQQAGVLQDIMREFYALSALLEEEVRAKRYEQDHVAHIYAVLERHAVLFKAWDERKEQLYSDVRTIFDSYPPAAAASSWYVSGKALRNLTDLDHDGLFKAKRFYGGDSTVTVAVQPIREAVREVISAEYDNMKDIEKIGRNNGACPYTPYEDLPQYSQTFSNSLETLKPGHGKDPNSYQHPYHELVYRYNEVVNNYNKFCSLAKVPLLPTVHQPELFAVTYPKAQKKEPARTDTKQPDAPIGRASQYRPADRPPVTQSTLIVHDTVYIEKRDTIYIAAGEDLHSMEGYAINHMVLLLDVSGSMESDDKLPLLKASVLTLMGMMRPEDKVSIISFSGKPKVLLESASFKDEARIRKAIEALRSSGKTDGDAGLKLAYTVADDNYLRGGNNRILLATDGEFPLNASTLALIQKFSGQDIFLSIFNFGKSPHAAQKLAQLAASGQGNYTPISRQNIERGLIREAKSKKKAQ